MDTPSTLHAAVGYTFHVVVVAFASSNALSWKRCWEICFSSMVDVVGAQLARVIARLEDYEKNWTPTIGRQVEQARLLYNELIVNADPDSELSVTGQVVLEQCISKLNAVLTEVFFRLNRIRSVLCDLTRCCTYLTGI